VSALSGTPEDGNPMSIPRENRLRKHSEFEVVYNSGRRHFSSALTAFYVLRTDDGGAAGANLGPRIGFTVGRQMGNAVTRNRIKRRMRAAVVHNLERLTSAVDVVINPKKAVLEMDFEQLCSEVTRAFNVVTEKAVPGQDSRAAKSQSMVAKRRS
jgi:ribonuclease P protein component